MYFSVLDTFLSYFERISVRPLFLAFQYFSHFLILFTLLAEESKLTQLQLQGAG